MQNLKNSRLNSDKLPPLLALCLVLILVVWLVSGSFYASQDAAPAAESASAPEKTSLKKVRTKIYSAQEFSAPLSLNGHLQPLQEVELKAQTAGRVEKLLVAAGDAVSTGQKLLQLSLENRPATLKRLQAEIKSRQADLDAAKKLQSSRLGAQNELLRLESSLLASQAELAAAELDFNYTQPQAPFAGILAQRQVEIGQQVQVGTSLFKLINLREFKAMAEVPQQQLASLQLGQLVEAQLLDGRSLSGKLTYISSQANPSTRTFNLEATLDNPELFRVAGASVSLHIQQEPTPAHLLSLALLSLNKEGQLGVKWVNSKQEVEFSPVRLLTSNLEGAWVSGLPQEIAIITRGAGFVEEGEQVQAVLEAPKPEAQSQAR